MSTIIYVSKGFAEYVGGVLTEDFGQDISADAFELTLGDSRTIPPDEGDWVTPDFNEQGVTVADRVLKKMVDDSVPQRDDAYYCWARIPDNSEVIPKMLQGPIYVR